MQPVNHQRYQEFQETIKSLNDQRSTLEQNIKNVTMQLEQMKKELDNLDSAIILHTGGMSTIEVLTENGYAIIKTDQQLSLTQFQADQITAAAIQSPITPQAQETFAPNPNTIGQPRME